MYRLTKPLLLRNARCWTGSDSQPWAEAALVQDGRFAFVGAEQDANLPAAVDTIDCRRRLVVPGFTDGHVHLLNTGMALRSVDLKDAASSDEAVSRVAGALPSIPEKSWLRGAGWDQHAWAGARFPTRQQLDAVSPTTPVVLIHTSGHCVWVNSVALHVAGVTRATETPAGGEIGRDHAGEPSGILFDNAMQLVYAAMPALSRDERVAAIRHAIEHAHSLGVTGGNAMDVGGSELSALETLRDVRELRFRTRVFMSAATLDRWLGEKRTGEGDDLLRIGGVKFFADGALGSLTAWMHEPYEGSTDVGFPLVQPDELERQVRSCLTNGLAPALHAIGDRANHEVLNILERTRDLAPELPRRIEHAQLLTNEDIARFAQLGVTASVQPIHATQDIRKVDSCWGSRGAGAYAFSSLLNSGANLAFGSDSPVETIDPLAGLHAAVTRRNARGEPAGGWYPNERLSVESALRAYGSGCARATNEESSLGRIAPGYHADFVVFSQDIFAVDDPMTILDTRVDMTVVAGEVVYRREEAW
jgi:predicted amidohydrolase YtcJ